MSRKAKNWTTLRKLRPGALFITDDGTQAVKTEYSNGNGPDSQCQCVLLSSGEYADFPEKNDTRVRRIIV